MLAQQSDLFRLTYFLETLKAMGWQNELVTQEEWTQGFSAYASTSTVYAAKALLERNYNEAGHLLMPMPLRFAGDISGIPALLKQCHLGFQREPDVNGLAVLTLFPVKSEIDEA
ncbi:conserved hypothetical protein [Enterobacterales bacterium 8AC]|nr:conserved hypothetical protein [Enterobacterales bacterium 8AC]